MRDRTQAEHREDENHSTITGRKGAHAMRAVPLDREHADEDDDGDRHDVVLEQGRHDIQALDRAEHRMAGVMMPSP